MRGKVNLRKLVWCALFLLVATGTAAEGRVIYVDADAVGANNGSSWSNAFNYLQDALSTTVVGDEIRVAQGTYKPDQGYGIAPGDQEATFQLINGVILKGGYAGFGEPDPDARDIEHYKTVLSGDLYGNDIYMDDAKDLADEPTRAENSYNVIIIENDQNYVLDGFVVTGGTGYGYYRGSGMSITGDGSTTILNCIFVRNSTRDDGGAISVGVSRVLFRNCRFLANSAGKRSGSGGAINVYFSRLKLTNCTFVGNSARFGNALRIYSPHDRDWNLTQLTNCILWDGGDEVSHDNNSNITITYSNVQGGWSRARGGRGGEGNIDTDPLFANPYNGDYHLKSQAGRWNPNSTSWVQDEITSPCIDVGDPNSPIGHEPFPNGGIINMGAYGGTAQASKSYFGEPVCEIIIAGDINGDCKVDFADLMILLDHWLEDANQTPESDDPGPRPRGRGRG